MRQSVAFWVVVPALLFVAVTSRGDVATTSGASVEGINEPITGSPLPTTPPPNVTTPRDPFTPYDVGTAHDPSHPNDHRTGEWRYEDLDAVNKALVDRGRDVTGWAKTQDAFAAGARELAARAAGARRPARARLFRDAGYRAASIRKAYATAVAGRASVLCA